MTSRSLRDGPITADELRAILAALGEQGREDVEWSEAVSLPETAEAFALEAIWVICNSGMKHSVARLIEGRVMAAIREGRPVSEAFGHKGKASAMQTIWDGREGYFQGLLSADDRLAFLESLPWIGAITKFHLAKNCGIDCAKPDVHLQRLAAFESGDCQSLCVRLAVETGYRVATVDLILWRACATGVIDSRAGVLKL